jgi:hypothetical protein
MGRSCPDLEVDLFFDADEIRSAYLLTDLKQPIRTSPQYRRASCLFLQTAFLNASITAGVSALAPAGRCSVASGMNHRSGMTTQCVRRLQSKGGGWYGVTPRQQQAMAA